MGPRRFAVVAHLSREASHVGRAFPRRRHYVVGTGLAQQHYLVLTLDQHPPKQRLGDDSWCFCFGVSRWCGMVTPLPTCGRPSQLWRDHAVMSISISP
jgi:hypothetical protein